MPRREHRPDDEVSVARAEREQADRDRDLDTLLSTDRGRRWLHYLIYELCHVSRSSYVPSGRDSTEFNEGARAVGELILDLIRRRSPKMYLKMHEEHHFDE